MANLLDKILKYKREEFDHLKGKIRLVDVRQKAADQEEARRFADSLKGEIRVIAEIKKASPSAGIIRENFDPVGLALQFEEAGAAALSVLTDAHFFQGSLVHLNAVRAKTALPLLRKDFVFDEYQIYEARGAGADAVLLIVRILEDSQIKDYIDLAGELKMSPLVEVHDEKDLSRAVKAGVKLIGINNRDLATLKTDLAVTETLAPQAPKGVVLVSESGIGSAQDVDRLKKVGVHAFLVGEALLKEKNAGEKLREFLSWSS